MGSFVEGAVGSLLQSASVLQLGTLSEGVSSGVSGAGSLTGSTGSMGSGSTFGRMMPRGVRAWVWRRWRDRRDRWIRNRIVDY